MLRLSVTHLRRSAAVGVQLEAHAALSTVTDAGKKPPKKDEADLDSFELLPPGCSIADPSYGHSMSDPVLIYDQTPVEEYRPMRRLRRNVEPPTSRAAAQAQLDAKKAAQAAAAGQEDDEPYVYLPPGSSMRDPGYSSLSDPLDRAVERRVYYRDPSPILRKK